MSRILASVLEAVGNTPLIRLNRVTGDIPATICVKVEATNPGRSVKDRIALAVVEDAVRRGLLKPGGTIVEPTSGNMGVALAIVAAVKGYKCIFTIPDKMSIEKIRRLRAFGAEVVVTPTAVPPESPQSYYSVARRLAEEIPGAYMPMQYDNRANTKAHYYSTGPEIWEQTEGKITHFVAGIGTGAILGDGEVPQREESRLRQSLESTPKVQSLRKRSNANRGRGAILIPIRSRESARTLSAKNLLLQYIDDVVPVSDRNSFLMGRRLTREEGLFCGGSSGAAVRRSAALRERKHLAENDLMVVLLPDAGEIYLSKMYSDEWMKQNQFLGRTVQVGEVLERKTRKIPELLSVEVTATVREAIAKMNQQGISQLPGI